MTMNSHDDEPMASGGHSGGRSGGHSDEYRADDRFAENAEDRDSTEGLGALGDWIDDLDYERLIRRYPLPALALAVVGGFVLGRTRGETVMNALSSFAVGHISEQVNTALGKDVL